MSETINVTPNTNLDTIPSTVTLPSTIAELTTDTLKEIGLVEMVKPGAARKELTAAGVNIGVSDNVAILAGTVTRSIGKAESSFRNAGLALGLINHYRVWETTTSPNGKVYGPNGQKRFYEDLFPAFSPKTILTYARTGETVYLPLKAGNPEYKGLESLAALPPSVVKEVSAIIDTDDGRKAVTKALEEHGSDRPITQKFLANVRKEFKSAGNTDTPAETTAKPGDSATDETIAEQLKGDAAKVKFKTCVNVWKNDNGETEMLIFENHHETFVTWMDTAIKDPDKAVELVKLMLDSIKSVNK